MSVNYKEVGPRASVMESQEPLAALLKELIELHESFEVFATEAPNYTLSQIRKGLDAQAALVNHECSRFVIVMRSATKGPVDLPSIKSLCANIAEACAKFVAMVQYINTLSRSSGVISGSLFRKEVQSKAKALNNGVIAMVKDCMLAVDKDGKLVSLGALAQMMHSAGSTLALSESMLKVAQTPIASVRRRLLNVGKLIKVSVEEIREDYPKKDLSTLQGRELEVAKIIDGGILIFRHILNVLRDLLALVDLFKAVPAEEGTSDTSTGEGATFDSATCEDLADCMQQLSGAIIDLAAALNDVEMDLRDGEEVQKDKNEYESTKPKKKYAPVEKDARGMVVLGGPSTFDNAAALESDELEALKVAVVETQKALVSSIEIAEKLAKRAPEGTDAPSISASGAVAEESIVSFRRLLD